MAASRSGDKVAAIAWGIWSLTGALAIALLCAYFTPIAQSQSPGQICYSVPAVTGSPFTNCTPVADVSPFPVVIGPTNIITGNATGSTSAVVGTLAAAANKTTYICGFDVSALGGTATVGPITIANTVGSSLVYQFSSTAAGATLGRTFSPCIPANAQNTAITVTTTADGSATAVDVNSWGYQR